MSMYNYNYDLLLGESDENEKPKPLPFQKQMDELQAVIKQSQQAERNKRNQGNNMAAASAIGGVMESFARPSITQSEILAGVQPKDYSQRTYQNVVAPSQIGMQRDSERLSDLLSQYKMKMGEAQLIGDIEKDRQRSEMLSGQLRYREEDDRLQRKHELQKIDRQNQGKKEIPAGKTGQGLTRGDGKVDDKFAEIVVDWGTGGLEKSLSSLDQVKESVADMETRDDVSGALLGMLGPKWKARFAPKGKLVQQTIEMQVTSSLRQILGAQFTEREGARILSYTFDPDLDEKYNAIKAKRLLKSLESTARAKDAAVNYFRENGTLKGYKGVTDLESAFENGLYGGSKPPLGKSKTPEATEKPKSIDNMTEEELDAILKQ